MALASFYATAIQALLVTMGLEQYCDTLSDNMIDVFCADAFCFIFNSLVARRLTLLLPKSNSPDMQVIRDKPLVLDLEPCFRYLDKDVKDCIRVVTPMVMLLEADGLDDAGIG